MTDTTPMALEVCCCGNCTAEGHEKETYRPLTADEIAQRQADAKAYEAAKAAEEAEAAAKAERRREVLIAIAGASGLTIQEVEEALA